ncbi:MAG: hypothetical protein KF696_02520 [Planctomycetes bacterium]|nr:hypothetical protein [Planctomycetota bacterium]MCW8134877.1 hypothetical protein [Planctomycetota bacterium]
MALLMLALNFGNPVFLAIAVFCLWALIGFPFAVLAVRIARPDAFSTIEAYLLGQVAGPLGLWLVVRANERAEYKRQMLMMQKHQESAPSPEIYDPAQGAPDGMPPPGYRAFSPPPDQPPPPTTATMDTWKP